MYKIELKEVIEKQGLEKAIERLRNGEIYRILVYSTNILKGIDKVQKARNLKELELALRGRNVYDIFLMGRDNTREKSRDKKKQEKKRLIELAKEAYMNYVPIIGIADEYEHYTKLILPRFKDCLIIPKENRNIDQYCPTLRWLEGKKILSEDDIVSVIKKEVRDHERVLGELIREYKENNGVMLSNVPEGFINYLSNALSKTS